MLECCLHVLVLGRGSEGWHPTRTWLFWRWVVVQEDEVLLQHAMEHGTKHWGELHASGRLPRRDNKACCNRFLFLKK